MLEKPTKVTKKIFCNTCKLDTKHEVKAVHARVEKIYDEDTGEPIFWEQWEYKLLACQCCDTALLEEAYTDAGMYDYEIGNQIEFSAVYPQRNYQMLSQKKFRYLDEKLEAIYKETITSFNAGIKIGCAMSLRALLEGICVEKGITDKIAWGLEDKLKKLEKDNHLNSNIVDCLLSFKFIGDNAAHKLESPSKDELELAISVMEDLLNFLFELEYELYSKAKKLAKYREREIAELKNRQLEKSKKENKDDA